MRVLTISVLPRDAGILFLGAALMFPTVLLLQSMFFSSWFVSSHPPPHMSSSLSRPPYSWFLSVSPFSCSLVPFNRKVNPLADQSIAFSKSILHHFSHLSSGSLLSLFPVLLCFSFLWKLISPSLFSFLHNSKSFPAPLRLSLRE